MTFNLLKLFEADDKSYAKALEAALTALKKLRPNGTVRGGQIHHEGDSYWERHEGYFDYSFEIDGVKFDATICVSYSKSAGVNQPPQYHFSFQKFKEAGQTGNRTFHPEADSGPFIKDLSALKDEITFWEKHIAEGLLRQKQRQADRIKAATPVTKPKTANTAPKK